MLATHPIATNDWLLNARNCTLHIFQRAMGCALARDNLARGAARNVRRLANAGAWTDAALALVKLELPDWSVRRLQRDGNDWHCAISRHGDLPDWLVDSAEAYHPDLAVAILAALIEARAMAASGRCASSDHEKRPNLSVPKDLS
jgi:hypothetical protein